MEAFYQEEVRNLKEQINVLTEALEHAEALVVESQGKKEEEEEAGAAAQPRGPWSELDQVGDIVETVTGALGQSMERDGHHEEMMVLRDQFLKLSAYVQRLKGRASVGELRKELEAARVATGALESQLQEAQVREARLVGRVAKMQSVMDALEARKGEAPVVVAPVADGGSGTEDGEGAKSALLAAIEAAGTRRALDMALGALSASEAKAFALRENLDAADTQIRCDDAYIKEFEAAAATNAQIAHEQHETEMARLKAMLHEQDDAAEDTIKKQKAELKGAWGEVASLMKETQTMRGQLKQANDAISGMRAELESAKAEATTSKLALQAARRMMADLEKERAKAVQEAQDAKAMAEDTKAAALRARQPAVAKKHVEEENRQPIRSSVGSIGSMSGVGSSKGSSGPGIPAATPPKKSSSTRPVRMGREFVRRQSIDEGMIRGARMRSPSPRASPRMSVAPHSPYMGRPRAVSPGPFVNYPHRSSPYR